MSDRNAFQAELVEVSSDSGPFKLARVSADGDEFTVRIIEPHGYYSNPMNKSLVAVFAPDGDLSKAWGMIAAPPADRVDGQVEGEGQIINHKTGDYIKLRDDGVLEIKAEKIALVGDVYLGSESASRKVGLKDTLDDAGHALTGDLATKVYGI